MPERGTYKLQASPLRMQENHTTKDVLLTAILV